MITKRLLFSILLVCAVGASQNVQARNFSGMPLSALQQQLSFIENKGQITDQFGKCRSDIQFKIAGKGINVFIGDGQLHYQWAKRNTQIESEKATMETYRMDVVLVGANKQAKVLVEEQQGYTEHYYLPSTGSEGAIANTYNKVTYKNIYPDIDWVLYIKDNKLEYDFVVRTGGKISDIQLQYAGSTSLEIREGNIIAGTPMGTVNNHAPYSFTAVNKQKIRSQFVLHNNVLGFKTDAYTGTVIIDPTVDWATYYGGKGEDFIADMLVDVYGSLYVSGFTPSVANIATIGSFQATIGGSTDVFLAKFTKDGVRIRGTYYGSTNNEDGGYIACDKVGNIYLSGQTTSTANITTTGSHQEVFGGGSSSDGLLVKFDSSGARQWCTYYGGSRTEVITSIACDSANNIYIAGYTSSSNGTSIATASSFQPTKGGGTNQTFNSFLAKFNGAGTRIWGTYFGGTSNTRASSVHADKYGKVYMIGVTSSSSSITTPSSHQPTIGGGADDFIAKFDSTGMRIWATYYGGSGGETQTQVPGRFIISDDSANIYVYGNTVSSNNISTPGSYQEIKFGTTPGDMDCYIAKFDSGGVRKWGTYFGGPGFELPGAILYKAGSIYILGATTSDTCIATPGNYQVSYAGGEADGYIAKFSRNGQKLWGTYYGHDSVDFFLAGTMDAEGNIYGGGQTNSIAGIATAGSLQTLADSARDAFIVKFCNLSAVPPSLQGSDSVCINAVNTISVTRTDKTTYLWELPQGWTGTSDSSSIIVTTNANGGTIKVRAVTCGDTSIVTTFNIYSRAIIPVVITVNGFVLGTSGTHSTYQWYKDGQPIPGATDSTYTVTKNGSYTVKVTNSGGCVDSSITAKDITNISVQSVYNLPNATFIYPNPANSIIYISAPAPVGINISGVDGKTVIQHAVVTSGVDISSLAQGMYLVRLIAEDGKVIKVEKLIKTAR